MSLGGSAECTSRPTRIRRLVEAVQAKKRLTPSTCKKLLEASQITSGDLQAWAEFDHPDCDSYGRRMIFDGGYFELMAMSWVDGDMAAIHDHGYTQWGAVKVFGQIEHAIFKQTGGVLSTAERRRFEPGSVIAVNHELIHQMGNVGQKPYMTLHLYGCYERDTCVTGDARLYELDENAIQITSGGVFFSLPEEAVEHRLQAPSADFPTTLRFKVELLRRLLRKNGSLARGRFSTPREARVARELTSAETWNRARQELDEKNADTPRELERYTGILHQEIYAAARLQLSLIRANLVRSPRADAEDRLAALMEESDLRGFAASYLELIGDTFSIDFQDEVAA